LIVVGLIIGARIGVIWTLFVLVSSVLLHALYLNHYFVLY